jgi:hypothetical protein
MKAKEFVFVSRQSGKDWNKNEKQGNTIQNLIQILGIRAISAKLYLDKQIKPTTN